MENEYIVINKTELLKELKLVEQDYFKNKGTNNAHEHYLDGRRTSLKNLLSQSTPLIPEIEKAFDAGFKTKQQGILMKRIEYTQQKQDYISNLKLDI